MGLSRTFAIYIALAVFAAGLTVGWTVRAWRCNAAYASATDKALKAKTKKQEVVDDVSQIYEETRASNDIGTVERTNTIREIYRTAPAAPADCAAPDAVRRVLEGGVSAANAGASGQPVSAVPASRNSAEPTERP
jgi:hypothetical protein